MSNNKEYCIKKLNKCKEEINAILEKHDVEINAESFYDGCWVELSINSGKKIKNTVGADIEEHYEIKM